MWKIQNGAFWQTKNDEGTPLACKNGPKGFFDGAVCATIVAENKTIRKR
jgi:hypothetical protein